MPSVDVTELFTDPDFASPITIIRATQVVNDNGRAVNTEMQQVTVGVIQPARARVLALLPDLARTSGAVEVWGAFDLKEGTQDTTADVVVWLGQRYKVVNVEPWRNELGGSWTHAVCELLPLVAPVQSVEVV